MRLPGWAYLNYPSCLVYTLRILTLKYYRDSHFATSSGMIT